MESDFVKWAPQPLHPHHLPFDLLHPPYQGLLPTFFNPLPTSFPSHQIKRDRVPPPEKWHSLHECWQCSKPFFLKSFCSSVSLPVWCLSLISWEEDVGRRAPNRQGHTLLWLAILWSLVSLDTWPNMFWVILPFLPSFTSPFFFFIPTKCLPRQANKKREW